MKPTPSPTPILLLLLLVTSTSSTAREIAIAPAGVEQQQRVCWECMGSWEQFVYAHNVVRARKSEQPFSWDSRLQSYAEWWASQRRHDCNLIHSFRDGEFTLGENIFWGGGSGWTPADAVSAWAEEERYYNYQYNSCVEGQDCGHYTQIVWKTTQKIGCARVVCDNGDVFITCNYYPPGNYVGQRPY